MPDIPALSLPDALVVRYFRAGELDQVAEVIVEKNTVTVRVDSPTGTSRADRWQDLGGGIGYVPDPD